MNRPSTSTCIVGLNAVLVLLVVALFTGMATQRTSAQTPATPNADKLTPSELEELLGPIALYPDPLLANVLAASVYPDEVAEAAKFIATRPTKEALVARPWEDPVKAVAEFPDVIKMMGEYPDWTIAVGQAYLTQAKDVMDVVQSLRKKAYDNGALKTSPEIKVQQDAEVIYIEPADPQVIYVPTYSPEVVYVDHHDDDWVAGAVGFGLGITAGLIIANNMDCHWHGGCVGWGGGWGHSDVDIDVDRNVNVGDVNVGNRGDTNIQGGDRTAKGGDRTNVKGGDRNASQNRVGNEGNAWAPNKNKNLASSKPSEAGKMRSGASNRMSTPNTGARGGAGGRPTQQPAGGANRGGAGGARPSQQPAGGNRGGAGGAGPSQQPAGGNRGGAGGAGPSQQPGGASRVPQNRPPSGFSGGSNTRQDSARGSSSRQSSGSRSGSSRSSGASRSSGGSRGGGSRGGGGRGGGGRR